MKNKPYPLNKVPQIKTLKEFAAYCGSIYQKETAFEFEQGEKTVQIRFQDFLEDMNGLGTALYHMGLDNTKIALIGENSYEWILSYFAVVNGGNVIVPIEPEISEDDLTHIIEQTEITCILCSEKYSHKVKRYIGNSCVNHILELDRDIRSLISRGSDLINQGNREYVNYCIIPDRDSSIIYTSGTTGCPKGVVLTHKNIITDTISALGNVHFAGPSLLILPLYHTFAFTASVLCILLSGKTIFISRNLKNVKNDFVKYHPQNLILVPAIIESLYKQIWIQAERNKKIHILRRMLRISNFFLKLKIDLRRVIFRDVHHYFGGNLDFIISGGASLSDKYVRGFRELGIQILNGYGITECSPVIAVNRNHYYRDQSVGQVLDGVKVKIVNDEIWVKGGMVTNGYYKNASLTAEVFEDGWFKTGDLGYLDEDGFLYITGRKKNLIVLGNGKKISPEYLENYLYDLDYVKEAVVYQNGDKIKAEVYLGNVDEEFYSKRIEQDLVAINSQLTSYKRISKVFIRKTEFPKTSTKKIRRL